MAKQPSPRNPMDHFPAKPRHDGRYVKRINGVLYYFGRDGDRELAVREYDRVKFDLYAGRAPPRPALEGAAAPGDFVRVTDMVSRYLHDRKPHLAADTYRQYRRALRRFAKWCGARRDPVGLTPDDLAEYGRRLHKAVGGYAFNRERAAVLAMFNHAEEQDWIDRAPKLGAGFRRVARRTLRAARKGRLLAPADVNALLGMARPDLFGMLLLGLNGGLGAEDCAALTWDAVDLPAAVLRFPRTKNAIPRTVPLWPETARALRRLRRRRPHDSHVFRTKRGLTWGGRQVAHQFRRLCRACGLPLPKGVGLGAARHTFATHANEVRDTDARRHIMGRLLPNLDDVYVETLFHVRLRKVVDHVRSVMQIEALVGDPAHVDPADRA